MKIRTATTKDIKEILNLLSQVLQIHHNDRPDIFRPNATKYDENELKEIINDDKRPIFVYEDATRVLGYAFCIIKETKDNNILYDHKTLYIDDLCVDKNNRSKGIGVALYNHVLSYARAISCQSITLNVWECNEGAKRFYKKMGLLPQKTIMEKLL